MYLLSKLFLTDRNTIQCVLLCAVCIGKTKTALVATQKINPKINRSSGRKMEKFVLLSDKT